MKEEYWFLLQLKFIFNSLFISFKDDRYTLESYHHKSTFIETEL